MAKLNIEIMVGEEWEPLASLGPEARFGSVSDNKDDGTRDVYVFGCLGKRSEIYRSKSGLDIDYQNLTREIITTQLEMIKSLMAKESYEIEIKTDKSQVKRKVKFTHID